MVGWTLQSPALFLGQEISSQEWELVGMLRLPRQAAAQALQPPCHPSLLGLCQIHPHICKHTPGLLGQRPNPANFPTSAHCPFPQLISHTSLLLHTFPAPGPWHMLLPGLNRHLSPPSPLPLD